MSTPEIGETLDLYLGSDNAVSSVLIREDQKIEKPVYYISKVLLDAEKKYSNLEKFAIFFGHICKET